MEKVFITKKCNLLLCAVFLTFLLFATIDIYFLLRETTGVFLYKIFLLQILILSILGVILLITFSQKIIINEHSITQIYRGIFRFYKYTIPWKDIIRVEGEFSAFHIGDKITLYASRKKMKIVDVIKARDRIVITNTIKDFKELVNEVIRNAYNAQLDKSLKKFVAT